MSVAANGNVVWTGRPSAGVYLVLYGVVASILVAVLLGLEVWAGDAFGLRSLFFGTLTVGAVSVPYAVEVATLSVVSVAYLGSALGLLLYQAGHKYELHRDGLYLNKGIANLENTFVSAMAFSDARLVRTLGMRIVGRSLIVVEANDGRRFEMKMLKDGMNVQALIRNNLSRPTVRLDR